jgi:glucose-1-phosphate cytidylyltransferase
MANGGKELRLMSSDIDDWNITFVDTGISSNVGRRLRAIQPYLDGERRFLANDSDGLTDLPLTDYIDHFVRSDKVGSFLAVRPNQSYHLVSLDGGVVNGVHTFGEARIWINGGFFIFRARIFDYLNQGEELVEEPFQRLIGEEQLIAHNCDGYWACMDTFKDSQLLEEVFTRGEAPWEVWKGIASNGPKRPACPETRFAERQEPRSVRS